MLNLLSFLVFRLNENVFIAVSMHIFINLSKLFRHLLGHVLRLP